MKMTFDTLKTELTHALNEAAAVEQGVKGAAHPRTFDPPPTTAAPGCSTLNLTALQATQLQYFVDMFHEINQGSLEALFPTPDSGGGSG